MSLVAWLNQRVPVRLWLVLLAIVLLVWDILEVTARWLR